MRSPRLAIVAAFLIALALCPIEVSSRGNLSGGNYPTVCSDIILQVGDSNSRSGLAVNGSAGYDPAIDVQNNLVVEFQNAQMGAGKFHTTILNYLLQYSVNANPNPLAIGPAQTFARDYYVPNKLAAGRNVMVVAAAEGGTGLVSDGYWEASPLGLGVSNSVARVNQAIAQNACNSIKLILWTTGANDAINATSQSAYLTAFATTAAYFRANITGATNVPILIQPLVPAWVATNSATFGPTSAALAAIPANVSKTGYVDPTAAGLSGNILGQTAVPYHLTAGAQRLIGNPGFANAWTNLSP